MKTRRRFLLTEMPSSFCNRKQNVNHESHKKVCENKDFRKAPFVVYADIECLIEEIDGCKINSKNLFRTKVGKHIPSGFSMPAVSSFKSIENKYDVYRGKDCIKKICESLREHAVKKIKFGKKLTLLTKDKRAAEVISKCKNLLYL